MKTLHDILAFAFILIGLMALVAILSGCTTAITKVSKANDTALQASEAVLCRGASIGSIMRKYGSDPAKAAAWRVLCVSSNEARILTE